MTRGYKEPCVFKTRPPPPAPGCEGQYGAGPDQYAEHAEVEEQLVESPSAQANHTHRSSTTGNVRERM
jgi:hypothetical protein